MQGTSGLPTKRRSRTRGEVRFARGGQPCAPLPRHVRDEARAAALGQAHAHFPHLIRAAHHLQHPLPRRGLPRARSAPPPASPAKARRGECSTAGRSARGPASRSPAEGPAATGGDRRGAAGRCPALSFTPCRVDCLQVIFFSHGLLMLNICCFSHSQHTHSAAASRRSFAPTQRRPPLPRAAAAAVRGGSSPPARGWAPVAFQSFGFLQGAPPLWLAWPRARA